MLSACDDGKEKDGPADAQSYSFTASNSVQLAASGGLGLTTGAEPPMCKDNICITPTSLSGQYYGAGLMIQSAGSGMMAYFGQESWSGTTGASTSYPFDFSSPTTQSGELVCCVGTGDLTDENTYFSDAVYLFAYVDATFEIDATSGAHGDAVGKHTVRFVLADDGVPGAKRGDLMYSQNGTFGWMDATGAISATRPAAPVVMNADVVSWTNPFGEQGNQAIPMVSASIATPAAGGVFTTSETELKQTGKTYTFAFDMTGFVVFPTLLKGDVGMLESKLAMLSKIHVQGLPHSQYQMGDAGETTLTIAD